MAWYIQWSNQTARFDISNESMKCVRSQRELSIQSIQYLTSPNSPTLLADEKQRRTHSLRRLPSSLPGDHTYPTLSHEFSTMVLFFNGLSRSFFSPLGCLLSVVSDPFVVSVGIASSSRELRSGCFFFNSWGGSCDNSWVPFADCVDIRMCRRKPEDDDMSRRVFQTKMRRRNSFRT